MPDPEHRSPESLVHLERTENETVIHLHGDIDLFNAGELRTCLQDVTDGGENRVVIDLADLDFIDSSGLGAMVGGMRRLRRRGGDVVLRSPRASTVRLLDVTGLSQVLTVQR
jgi:anti-anti-sigma factor